MRVVIAGGSGLIGRALTASLVRDGATVDVLSRDTARANRRLPPGVRAIGWDPSDRARVRELADVLAGADAVVNVSGVPVGPVPWTPGRKRAIVASRVGTNEVLGAAIAALEPARRPTVFVSAAGTDGYTGLDAEPATEGTDTRSTEGFLSALGRDWEAAAERVTASGVRVVLIRTSFVLAAGSDLMGLLALPVRLGFGGRYGDGRQWFSWIHLDDLVAVYRRAIEDPAMTGPVNATSPTPCRQFELAAALAHVLRRPNWFRVPAWLLRLVLQGEATLLLGSRRVVPAKLAAAGFEFRYPKLEDALRAALGKGDRRGASAS
jgi:uncharacterized protein (TIGR01777 family)